jgi:hypothetical protein
MYHLDGKAELFDDGAVKSVKQTNQQMKPNSFKSLIVMVAITVAGLSSCKKEDVKPITTTPTPASVEAIASENAAINYFTFKSIMIAFGATKGNMDIYKTDDVDDILSSCSVITKDTTVFPYEFRVEIQPNCTLNNGTPVSGVIKGTWTDKNFGSVAGSRATLDFDSFYINGSHVLGRMTLQNKSTDISGNTFFDIQMTNGAMIFGSDGRLVKQDVIWLLEWKTLGNNDREDDTYNITGHSSGVTSNGDSYTEQITTPLVISRASGCVRHFISGVTLAQINNNPDMQIDYGDGICDRRAVVTQGGISRVITLQDY